MSACETRNEPTPRQWAQWFDWLGAAEYSRSSGTGEIDMRYRVLEDPDGFGPQLQYYSTRAEEWEPVFDADKRFTPAQLRRWTRRAVDRAEVDPVALELIEEFCGEQYR